MSFAISAELSVGAGPGADESDEVGKAFAAPKAKAAKMDLENNIVGKTSQIINRKYRRSVRWDGKVVGR